MVPRRGLCPKCLLAVCFIHFSWGDFWDSIDRKSLANFWLVMAIDFSSFFLFFSLSFFFSISKWFCSTCYKPGWASFLHAILRDDDSTLLPLLLSLSFPLPFPFPFVEFEFNGGWREPVGSSLCRCRLAPEKFASLHQRNAKRGKPLFPFLTQDSQTRLL